MEYEDFKAKIGDKIEIKLKYQGDMHGSEKFSGYVQEKPLEKLVLSMRDPFCSFYSSRNPTEEFQYHLIESYQTLKPIANS